MSVPLRVYRSWFYAAAAYNLAWGIAVVVWPGAFMRITGLNVPGAAPLVQVMGMMVGVYAFGYYLMAREPLRYAGFIWIALAGKTFGPLGFLYAAAAGTLPWSFGWVCLFNDLIWWPVFWAFALTHARSMPYRAAGRDTGEGPSTPVLAASERAASAAGRQSHGEDWTL